MSDALETQLTRWRQAGLIDPAAAERIRGFEAGRAEHRGRWPVVLALAAGGIMLSAGVMLFVAAHWANLPPGGRIALLVATVAGLHLAAGWVAPQFPALATTLHGVGTVALGAAIFLAGQTFNLEILWPRAFLVWALGAWIGVFLLRSWPQVFLAAVLTPAWLAAEWTDQASSFSRSNPTVVVAGLLLLATVYLLAHGRDQRAASRATLAIVGSLSIMPLAALLLLGMAEMGWRWDPLPSVALRAWWWSAALLGPLILALVLRGRASWQAGVAALWIVMGLQLGSSPGPWSYLWAAVGAMLLVGSGVVDASRRRINLGIAGFALTVVVFYFSSVLDKLGRATSLLVGGALFLVVGWMLERTRRQLVAKVTVERPA